MIQQQVQLDGSLGPPELRPVEQRHAQVDDRGVQAQQPVLEPKFLLAPLTGHPSLAAAQQLLEYGLEQLPRPVFVGVAQRRPLRRHRNPQVLQLALTTGQPSADLPQRMRPPQLAEQHGYELTPTGEAPRVVFRLVLFHRAFELQTREQLQQLRENATESSHG